MADPIRLVNLTPHRLRVLDADGATLLDQPPAAEPARIEQITTRHEQVGKVPIRAIRYGQPTALPAATEGVLLVVSRVVAQQTPRADLIFPDDEIRDEQGRIVACRTLARFDAPVQTPGQPGPTRHDHQ
jgi:hypothetical protein